MQERSCTAGEQHRRGSRPAREKTGDILESVEQLKQFRFGVVKIRARPRQRGHVEPFHQRLGAVMPGPDADATRVEEARDVVRVGALERERDHRLP